jgi:ABC-type nickel/cobalt efflux system permease component RcnA
MNKYLNIATAVFLVVYGTSIYVSCTGCAATTEKAVFIRSSPPAKFAGQNSKNIRKAQS